MLPRDNFIARYRFKKSQGDYCYLSAVQYCKLIKKFRDFCFLCGEGLKPRSRLEKYYTEKGHFEYDGKDLYFEITVGEQL
jgi:hypothetical protein